MLTHFVSLHPLFSSIWKPSSRVNKTYSAKVKTFFVNFSKIEGPNYSFCLFGSDVYIHDVFIHIYKHLIQKEICSSNFPIVSTLLWEIVILYFDTFRNKNYSKKLVLCAAYAVVNAADVHGVVRSLVVSRNKALMGSIVKAVKTFEIDSF